MASMGAITCCEAQALPAQHLLTVGEVGVDFVEDPLVLGVDEVSGTAAQFPQQPIIERPALGGQGRPRCSISPKRAVWVPWHSPGLSIPSIMTW